MKNGRSTMPVLKAPPLKEPKMSLYELYFKANAILAKHKIPVQESMLQCEIKLCQYKLKIKEWYLISFCELPFDDKYYATSEKNNAADALTEFEQKLKQYTNINPVK